MKQHNKARSIYAIAAFVILAIEIIIALFVNDAFIRPYFGDVLVPVLICCTVRAIVLQKVKLLPLWVFLFAVAVELAQLINIVNLLGLSSIEFFRIIIGSTFSFADILCYACGCLMFFTVEYSIIKRQK